MKTLNPFLDSRKIPKLNIKFKVKVKTNSIEETSTWNKVFGYIMKKPRTKLEFINISSIRKLSLKDVTLDKIKPLISQEDYLELVKIEDIFNNRLTNDLKAFILGILKLKLKDLESL